MAAQKVKIGEYCTIASDVEFGDDVVVHGHVNLYGCRIGDGTRIGAFVEVQENVVIGERVRVQSHSFICSGTVIESDVFIGHNVNFINDRYPTVQGAMDGDWKLEPVTVRRKASIGTGAVILCGVEIGEEARVGAGSVVTNNVPPRTVFIGVPAKQLHPAP